MRPSAPHLLRVSALLLVLGFIGNPISASAQPCDVAPRLKLSASQWAGAVGIPTVMEVTAYDPNGDAITSLSANTLGLPPGNNAVFTPNATSTAGTLTWTPQAGQTGLFNITFTATNSLSASATGQFFVTDTGGAPFVRRPLTAIVRGFNTLTFTVYADDPEGDPITSLTCLSNMPGSTFTASPDNRQGTFSWTPGFTQGSFTATFTATSSSTASYTTTVTSPGGTIPPVVTAPLSVSGAVGVPISFCVTAFDFDDPIASLTYNPVIPTAQFVLSPTNEVGLFSWTPPAGAAGVYTLTFSALGEGFPGGAAATTITVAGDRSPTLTAPAAVNGTENQPINFTVTASDPDGDAINAFTAAQLPPGASFVPAMTNTTGAFSWTPFIGQAGTYFVVFTASNALTTSATTQINVASQVFSTLVFTAGGNKTLRLGSNKAQWCVNVEPVNGIFSLSDISLPSLVLRSTGNGCVSEIHAITGKSAVVG
ncbi:MAG TPA: putative Ig domain-containing protein, partial [Candidatus Eisenbacteria bacterium]|nr:putative Ig domain-containing protein [Candidatus Eisenbacteria bacterium]